MSEDKIYVGDVGTEIIVDMQETLAGATGMKFSVKKPDGATAEWTVAIYQDTHLKYTVQAGDLSVQGVYMLQPGLTIGAWSGSGHTVKFKVYAGFK